jgi:alpha,alpha-trehalase
MRAVAGLVGVVGWLLLSTALGAAPGAANTANAANAAANAADTAAVLEPPQAVYKDLFVAVQMQDLFGDSKAFADAEARTAPRDILAQYHRQKPDSPDALKAFVEGHFNLVPEAHSPQSPPEQVPILRHIDRLWDPLTRSTPTAPPHSSLLAVPHPYVVPGGRFREVYYWDSYFTMLGLAQSGRRELVENMVRDFGYLIDTYGHVPNGTRSYYLSRSQPPFFYLMVALFADKDASAGDARYLTQLRREYAFWMDGEAGLQPGKAHRRVVAMPDGSILNRYWDDRDTPRDESYREDVALARQSGRPAQQFYRDIRAAAESGWDFSSRWFADGQSRATIQTTQIVPADLNSLLYGLENAIRAGCKRRADKACAVEFERRAKVRAAAIDRYLWDEDTGAYYDYQWAKDQKIAHLSAATLYPLFVGVASDAQADKVGRLVTRELLAAGGLVASQVNTGEQWDAPNGWAPLQWIAVDGLRRYGQNLLAERIACRWMLNVQDVYQQSGRLVEKYDVMTTGRSGGGGEYPTQDGFGWTNGVLEALSVTYKRELEHTDVAQCH